ncbi:bifunctional diguanylate cyclase/phosphodiesterase [Salinicola rhizosphaerae]|uniref:GGDEF domain-containing protein n=1 Tax=Salinicola rhizosphaerae TaxID=1443141 RepID=A0ABQ3ECH2_9GAMM|nr:bifunctional diguanylate cyclase/phosphodiesterase [Salinicola rhizosphaerae]GHB33149.1 GGDEF domain-containing protein [Salinicola rhizosphaerae]
MFDRWNLWLIALSYVVATLASFTALELTRQVRHAAVAIMRRIWLCCGSCAMGLGIWSMHFVGMLAWKPADAMSYQAGLTLISLLLAIASSALALRLAGDSRTRSWMLLPGGLVMGAGIALMHYTGMAAMDMGGMDWAYDVPIFILSILIAIVAATAALWLFRVHSERATQSQWHYRLLSAAVMGFAVCGMHYTGMAAMQMEAHPFIVEQAAADSDTLWLAVSIGTATLMILGFTLVQLLADGKLSAQIKMGRELQQLLDSTHRTLDLERLQGRVMLNAIDDGVLTIDQHGVVQHANPTALTLIGVSEERAIGQPFGRLCRLRHESEDRAIPDPLSPVLDHGKVVHLYSQIQLESWDQHQHYIDLKASPLRAAHAEVIGAVVILRDISFRREMMDQLEHQAMHDSLTGLRNRRALDQEMLRYRHRLDSDNDFLLFLDLDHFKVINDSCGHSAGDEVLCDFARLLLSHFEAKDFVARLGGDEFAVLINGRLIEAVLGNVERLRHAVTAYTYEHKGRRYGLGVSIGLVAMNRRFRTTEEVMIAADRACYSAKCAGRNRLKVYEEGDRQALQREHEALWMPRLKEALRNDRFVLYAQRIDPVTADATQEQPHQYHEILLRYVDDQGHHVPPGVFLPVAERGDLMPEIDRWVIHHTFILLSKRLEALSGQERFAINLSGQRLGDDSFAAWIIEQLSLFSIPPSIICFEITETAAISGFDSARRFMETLSHHGCDFALDDFGSGMSSFAYLAALPIKQIKIDGSFVRELVDNDVNRAIVSSISGIGRSLGLKTIAEFVEDDQILAGLRELGVDFAQGYGIDRPSEASYRFGESS